MAKTEKITDDFTKEPIEYPYISAISLRVEISPTKFAWMGSQNLLSFANGENLGKWAQARMNAILARHREPDTDY